MSKEGLREIILRIFASLQHHDFPRLDQNNDNDFTVINSGATTFTQNGVDYLRSPVYHTVV